MHIEVLHLFFDTCIAGHGSASILNDADFRADHHPALVANAHFAAVFWLFRLAASSSGWQSVVSPKIDDQLETRRLLDGQRSAPYSACLGSSLSRAFDHWASG